MLGSVGMAVKVPVPPGIAVLVSTTVLNLTANCADALNATSAAALANTQATACDVPAPRWVMLYP